MHNAMQIFVLSYMYYLKQRIFQLIPRVEKRRPICTTLATVTVLNAGRLHLKSFLSENITLSTSRDENPEEAFTTRHNDEELKVTAQHKGKLFNRLRDLCSSY